jgi:uncharacterized protein (TIGR03067 family)
MVERTGLDGTWLGGATWMFDDAKRSLKVGTAGDLEPATYKVTRHGKRPWRLEVTISAEPRKGQKWHLIYEIQGDILKIGYVDEGEGWPAGFDDKGITIHELKRDKR